MESSRIANHLLLLVFVLLFCNLCSHQLVNGQVLPVEYAISTVAGGSRGEGVSAVNVGTVRPYGVSLSSGGTLFFTETNGVGLVRFVNVSNGLLQTCAGGGSFSLNSVGLYRPAKLASFTSDPKGLVFGLSSEIYVADASGGVSKIIYDSNEGYKIGLLVQAEGYSYTGGMAIDPNTGTLYVAESKRIVQYLKANSTMSDVVGGVPTYLNNVGPRFTSTSPGAIAFHPVSGDLYWTERNNGSIRYYSNSTGLVKEYVSNSTLVDPYGLTIAPNGDMFVSEYSTNRIKKILSNMTIITIANVAGSSNFKDGEATSSGFNGPTHLALNSDSTALYIADSLNNRVRKIDLVSNVVSTVAGDGTTNYKDGEGFLASQSVLSNPQYTYYNTKTDELLIADTQNNKIRKISSVSNPSSAKINTVFGNGTLGDAAENSNPLTSSVRNPASVFQSEQTGDIFVGTNGLVYRLENSTQKVKYLVGGLTTTTYNGEGALAVSSQITSAFAISTYEADQSIYFLDYCRIRKIDSKGILTTVIGTVSCGDRDGPANNASLSSLIYSLAVNGSSGDIVIGDFNNNKVKLYRNSSDTVTTIVGDGQFGNNNYENVIGTNVSITPGGLVFLPSGELLISDTNSFKIKKLSLNGNITSFIGSGLSSTYKDNESPMNCAIGPAGLALHPITGELYFADFLFHSVRKYDTSVGIITTVAGNGTIGFTLITNGASASTLLNTPGSIAFAPNGDLYISLLGSNQIIKLAYGTNYFQVAVGTGSTTYNGDYLDGELTNIGQPRQISYLNGSIIFGDYTNNRLRRYIIATKKVETLAGGFGDYAIGTNAIINTPYSMTLDTSRNELYIGDTTQSRIRKVSLSTQIITTVVGTSYSGGTSTTLSYTKTEGKLASIGTPIGLAYSADQDKVYFCESNRQIVDTFDIPTSIVERYAGVTPAFYNDGVSKIATYLEGPQSVAFFGGEVIIAETGGHVIRKINSQGIVNRIAGIYAQNGFDGDSNDAKNVSLNSPKGLSVLKDGRIVFADSTNNRIRMLTPYCKTGYQMVSSTSGALTCQATCFGISFNSSNVCSGRGTCTEVNTCVCRQGYLGPTCSFSQTTLLGSPSYVIVDSSSKIVNLNLIVSKLQLTSQALAEEFVKACTKNGVECTYKMEYSVSSQLASYNESNIAVSLFNNENGIISLSPAFVINKLTLNSYLLANIPVRFSFVITNALGNELSFEFSVSLVLPLSYPTNLFSVKVGTGSAIKDNFTITINEWTGAVSSMLPLKYAIGILPTQTNDMIRLTPFSENRNVTFVMPYLKTSYNVHILVIYVMDVNGNINSKTSTNAIIVNPFSGSTQDLVTLVQQPNPSYNLLTALTYDRSYENITDSSYYSSLISNIVIDIKDIATPLAVMSYLSSKSLEKPVVEGTLEKLSEMVQKLSTNYNNSKNDVGYVTSKVASVYVNTLLNLTSNIWSTGYSVNSTREFTSNLANLLLIGEIPSVLSDSSTISSSFYSSSNINLTISSFRMNSIQAAVSSDQSLTQSSLQVKFNPSYIISKYSAVSVDCGVSLISFSSNIYGTDHINNTDIIGRNSTSSISDFKFLKNQVVQNLENLENPIILTFPLLNSISVDETEKLLSSTINSTVYNLTCAFLEESTLKWSSQGCSLKSYDLVKGIIECACNHTTLFTTFLEQKTIPLSDKTKSEVASLYYGQISLGIFYLLVSTVVLVLLIIFRNQQPLSSRLATPYLGMIALMTESLLIYIVQRSVLVDQLFKDSTNWESGDLASNWIANIVIIFVNTLNLTAILAYLIQVCRYQLMKYLYNILYQMRKNQSASQENLLKTLRRFTSNTCVNGILIGFAILNVIYWTLWVILRRSGAIYLSAYTYIVSISYIVIIFGLSALITCISFADFIVSMIKQYSSNKKSKEEIKKGSKVDLQDVKEKISSLGIHKWIVSMDSPLFFRGEMLLYILFFILLIVNQSLGMSTLPFRYETEESYRKVLTNDMIGFIFETLYVAVYILVFGGYSLLIILSNIIKFKLRKLPSTIQPLANQEDEEDNKEMLQVIENPYGRSLMEDFCKKEFSTENLYLYLDLQENQHLINNPSRELAHFISRIHDNYIRGGSSLEVNIPSSCSKQFIKLYKSVNEQMNNGNTSSSNVEMMDLNNTTSPPLMKGLEECFQTLQDNVILNLSDTFSRFVLTDEYGFFSEVFDFTQSSLGKSLNI